MLPKESFIQWARECLAYEVSTNFTRAQMFNSFLCRIAMEALRRQPPEHLEALTTLLPTGVGWSDSGKELRDQLPATQKRIVEQYIATKHEIYLARTGMDDRERHAKTSAKEFREEHRATSKRCKQMVKEIAADWDYDLEHAGSGEWELIAWKRWGTISIDLCFRDMTLEYDLSLAEKGQVRGHFDSYLSALGLSHSVREFGSAAEAEKQFLKAMEFIRWHVDEYDRIVEASLPQQTPAQPGQTANPQQTGTP